MIAVTSAICKYRRSGHTYVRRWVSPAGDKYTALLRCGTCC